ncbi:MAG: AraC family transcriptional regulator [Mariniblastus sp.]|nr:AraC family transcriptional regulator [Mariniblastus sp.]
MKSPIPHKLMESVFDSLGDVVFCIKDRQGRYESVNQALVDRVNAADKSDLIGKTATDIFPESLAKIYSSQDQHVLTHAEPILDQLEQINNIDGNLGWYLASKFPIFDDQYNLIGLVGISQDLHSPSDRDLEMANVKSVVDFIKSNLGTTLRTEPLAEQAGMSCDQLDRRMKRVFRLSTKKFIMKSRLEEATRLLVNSDRSLVEVATDCGFADQSAFTRHFRAAVQVTPAVYRKQNHSG